MMKCYFFETSENNHKIILHAKKRVVEFTGHLKSVEVQLDYRFYRCHRSYIVNTDMTSSCWLMKVIGQVG